MGDKVYLNANIKQRTFGNGGAVLNFRTPIRITANTNFGFTSATVTTHTVTVCGYTAP